VVRVEQAEEDRYPLMKLHLLFHLGFCTKEAQ
jgi:hypothetical protein